jgi:hypothetical protein
MESTASAFFRSRSASAASLTNLGLAAATLRSRSASVVSLTGSVSSTGLRRSVSFREMAGAIIADVVV